MVGVSPYLWQCESPICFPPHLAALSNPLGVVVVNVLTLLRSLACFLGSSFRVWMLPSSPHHWSPFPSTSGTSSMLPGSSSLTSWLTWAWLSASQSSAIFTAVVTPSVLLGSCSLVFRLDVLLQGLCNSCTHASYPLRSWQCINHFAGLSAVLSRAWEALDFTAWLRLPCLKSVQHTTRVSWVL